MDASGGPPSGVSADRIRLDHLLVQRGLAETGAKAQAYLLAGRVRVPGRVNPKAGDRVSPDQIVEVTAVLPYVSRGGEKLAGALDAFGVDPRGRACWDVGASTGGFTDCLLKRGAASVWAVDVGHGQLHWKLRGDSRVTVREKTHVLAVTAREVAAVGPSLAVVDVSFISLEKVLPHLGRVTPAGTEFVVLVKPQFEAGPVRAPGGVVRDPAVHREVLDRVSAGLEGWGFRQKGMVPSVLTGPKGNVEFFMHLMRW
jgi:23S rRNA (cytidine1920-2'-O)/16S rRNA (cytidine1409-2'-O)-methyltransferase